MGIGCTEFQCFLIHHLHKLVDASADMLCDRYGCIITGIDQQTMQKFIKCYLITFLETDFCRTGFLIQRLCRNGHNIIHISILECQDCCHDLCDTCRIGFLMNVLCEHHSSMIQIKQTGFRRVTDCHAFQALISGRYRIARSKRRCFLCTALGTVCAVHLILHRICRGHIQFRRTAEEYQCCNSYTKDQYKNPDKDQRTLPFFPDRFKKTLFIYRFHASQVLLCPGI